MIRAVLFDLDGVIRLWDDTHTSDIEARYGIPTGSIKLCALTPPVVLQVTTGQVSRREWLSIVAEEVGSSDAVHQWANRPVRVDYETLGVANQVRTAGTTVALCTNGTDNLQRELDALRISYAFDRVFNSAEIGYAKPDPRIYKHIIRELRCRAACVAFVDDNIENIESASRLGLVTHLYQGRKSLAEWLRSLGIVLSV